MEKVGYFLLGIVALCWLLAMVVGMIAAFPIGLVGLIAITGVGFLFARVVKDRFRSKEDDYYSKNVKK